MRMIKLGRINSGGLLLLLAGVLTIFISCINFKKMPTDKSALEIHFGKSGGFTNSSMEYIIYENGDISKIQNGQSQKISSINKKKIKKIINLLLDSDFEHLKIMDLGNITYFITVRSKKYENTVKWNDLTNNNYLNTLYKELLTTTKP